MKNKQYDNQNQSQNQPQTQINTNDNNNTEQGKYNQNSYTDVIEVVDSLP